MGGALFPTEDQRRDHFPVLCCMRAERHLASIPQGSGAEHVAISVRQCPQLNWIVDPPPRVYGTHVNVRFGSLADILTSRRAMSDLSPITDVGQRIQVSIWLSVL